MAKSLPPPLPEIQNLTAPPSAPGDPIEANVFNAFNQAKEIALFRNQGLEVDNGMEPALNKFPLVYTPDSDTLFEGQKLSWYGIDCHVVVAHNQKETCSKNGLTPQRLSYTDIFIHCLLLK